MCQHAPISVLKFKKENSKVHLSETIEYVVPMYIVIRNILYSRS